MGGNAPQWGVSVRLDGSREQTRSLRDRRTHAYASIHTYYVSPRSPRYEHPFHNPQITHTPPGLTLKNYRADVVFLSHSGKYLFATSRANSFSLTGYISAFSIGPKGNVERLICLNPTPTSGGHSNAVSPCPWSDEWLALTDDQTGFVEIYRWHEEFLARVAHLDVHEPGFGMNAIWYD